MTGDEREVLLEASFRELGAVASKSLSRANGLRADMGAVYVSAAQVTATLALGAAVQDVADAIREKA